MRLKCSGAVGDVPAPVHCVVVVVTSRQLTALQSAGRPDNAGPHGV